VAARGKGEAGRAAVRRATLAAAAVDAAYLVRCQNSVACFAGAGLRSCFMGQRDGRLVRLCAVKEGAVARALGTV